MSLAKTSTRLCALGRLSCRSFSVSSKPLIAISEMKETDLSSLRVNKQRLMQTLHHTCEWGKGERWGSGETETGMSRLSLSDDDKLVRDWFRETCSSLGCKVDHDAMGNQFAIRPGLDNSAPPTYAGSHLDTQPSGGRYDGILGVVASVEMLRVLNDNWIESNYPIGVVNWTNEEGARFPRSMNSSGVWSGSISQDEAHSLRSVIPPNDTATMKTELQRIGYLGNISSSWQNMPMAGHFELHIEQGPILEASKQSIGIVRGVQSYQWHTVTVKGQESHTGATSFAHRADALLTASKMILASHSIAAKHDALASTGILMLKPGSTNTVPGEVHFTLDVRAAQDEIVDTVVRECASEFAALASGEILPEGCVPSSRQCTVSWTEDFVSPATHFSEECGRCITTAAKRVFGNQEMSHWGRDMMSGAGHDSVNTSRICPTGMIFVPCRDGVSHNPKEFASEEACEDGANVLLGAVVEFDKLRGKK
ncbi:N-carbamoyl-L-amino acid hydrolase [Piedraia hortae CBS 480.64]|uniref:N-carbamoyl-L-amino acid hydrolase n=1 Tax=Piedraia hortae CBS 480.64 TaxID=1314780 RepID=A0A6A7BSV5_9PEZI|nr:N-carbamoyl-L-amino acid hydrolase [Piedraia hortae CBS 480.64]